MRKLLCFLVLSTVGLRADLTVKDYREITESGDKDSLATLRMYIAGLGSGLNWANAEAQAKSVPLYCQPGTLALNTDNNIHTIEVTIKKFLVVKTQADLDKWSLGLILVRGLVDQFPCGAK
jgi:hypothetical protein